MTAAAVASEASAGARSTDRHHAAQAPAASPGGIVAPSSSGGAGATQGSPFAGGPSTPTASGPAGSAREPQAASASGPGTGSRELALAIGGGDSAAEYGPYLAGLRALIQDLVRYPHAARRRGISGTVHLELLITPEGVIHDVAVVRSSSHALLDQAAVESVRSVRPPPLPRGVERRPLRVRVPVVFELQ